MPCLAFAFAITVAGCATTKTAQDDDEGMNGHEETVTVDQLPGPVKATLTKEIGGAKIEEIDKENHHGRTVYEADVMMDGKKWEIAIRDDGQLIRKQLDEENDDEDQHEDRK